MLCSTIRSNYHYRIAKEKLERSTKTVHELNTCLKGWDEKLLEAGTYQGRVFSIKKFLKERKNGGLKPETDTEGGTALNNEIKLVEDMVDIVTVNIKFINGPGKNKSFDATGDLGYFGGEIQRDEEQDED
ncbi:hypothetical protein KC19_VG320500 [Ceratodon purpureus]|uniref:Uncharacterized protein n=1 Tax=Ceratodon purpureus TaxID=3225 RepID=A0A8T0HVN4_CERPU|nr:hypothetical protein KC19_VG320500 [Ceratodon purpureus]